MARNLTGYVFNDAGTAVESANVTVYAAGDAVGSSVTTTTTDSNGKWTRSVTGDQGHDIKIQSGSSVRYLKGNDDVQFNEVWVHSSDSATEAPLRVDNSTNNASVKVLELRSGNSSRADGDEIYISGLLDNDAGEATEYGRITIEANDVSNGTEDGEIRFSVMKGGTLTDVWQIDASASAVMSFDMNVDTLTFGSGGDTDITLNFDANSNDGVLAWMEDEDLFKFSDDILLNTTEKIYFHDAAGGEYIYASSDGHLEIVAGTTLDITAPTVDLNSSTEFNIDTAIYDLNASGVVTLTSSSTLTAEGTTITLDSSGDIVLDADGDDITFKAGSGDTTGLAFTNTSGSWVLKPGTSDSDFTIAGNDGGSNVNALVFDMSEAGKATFNDVVVIGDSKLTLNATAVTSTAAELNLLDGVSGLVQADFTKLAAIDATADEVNLIDGGTARGTTSVASGDGILINDGGTMRMTNVDTVSTYFAGHSVGGTNIATVGTITTGTWNGTAIVDSYVADALTISGGTVNNSVIGGSTAAAITGTTIDAETDFTIGSTVITDDSIVMTPTANDTVTIAGATDGVLNVTTVDTAAASANLNFVIDGAVDVDAATTINLDSGSGIWTLEDGGTEVLRFTESGSGDVTIKLVTNAKDLIFTDNGDATGLTIKDAAAGIVVPGEVMTTKVSYTDGDDALTIADGGGVTFPQSSTFTSGLTANDDITIAADKSLNLPHASHIAFTDPIADNSIDDHDAQGIIMTFKAGSTVTPFSPVYLHTDNEVHEADADEIAKMPCIGVSVNVSDVADGADIEVMVLGLIRDDDFNFGTAGAPVYVAAGDPGLMTNTAPSGTDDVDQIVGHSIGDDALFVQPCLTTIEHA